MFDVMLPNNALVANDQIQEAVIQLKKLQKQMQLLKRNQDDLVEKIKTFMGDNEELYDVDGTRAVDYKVYEGTLRLDADAVKRLYPDVYRECLMKSKDVRRFILK